MCDYRGNELERHQLQMFFYQTWAISHNPIFENFYFFSNSFSFWHTASEVENESLSLNFWLFKENFLAFAFSTEIVCPTAFIFQLLTFLMQEWAWISEKKINFRFTQLSNGSISHNTMSFKINPICRLIPLGQFSPIFIIHTNLSYTNSELIYSPINNANFVCEIQLSTNISIRRADLNRMQFL